MTLIWKEHLYDRGLTDDQIEYFQIEPAKLVWNRVGQENRCKIIPCKSAEATGWRYPCYYPDLDETIHRYKAFPSIDNGSDTEKPKKKPLKVISPNADELPNGHHPPFYVPHREAYETLLSTIAERDGTLWGVEGEPDVWALDVIRFVHVIGFVGAGNIPQNLAAVLSKMGVKNFLYLPDADWAGHAAAQKISDLLHGSKIGYRAYNTPQEWEGVDVKDTTDILKVQGYSREAFGDYLVNFLRNRQIVMHPPKVRDEMEDRLRKRYKPELWDEVESRLSSHAAPFSLTPYKSNGFSKNIPCPFHHHTDDRKAKTENAFGWNRDSHWGFCFKCASGNYTPEDVAEVMGISLEDYVLPAAKTKPKPKPKAVFTGKEIEIDNPRSFIVRQSDTMREAIKRARGETFSDDIILPFPFNDQRLYDCDGLTQLLTAGKIVLAMGPSGGGKTTSLSVFENNYNLMGIHTLRWSPEYTAQQHGDKLIQRFNGGTYKESLYNDLYWMEQRNSTTAWRYGRKMTDIQQQNVIQTAQSLAEWPGESFIIDRYGQDVYDLLDMFDSACDYALSIGKEISVLFFDYAQLPRSPEGNSRWNENDTAHALKEWANQRYEYVSELDGVTRLRRRKIVFIGSQVTKLSSKQDKKGEEEITEEDAKALSAQWFNLILGIRMTNNPHPTNRGWYETIWVVLKNSDGKKYFKNVLADSGGIPPGKVRVWYDSKRFLFTPDRPMDDYAVPVIV